MAGSIKDFISAFYQLLPKGVAWNNNDDSDTYKLVSALSVEPCRMDERLDDLERELDPFQTSELLEDYEAMLGLPETCLEDLELSVADRRQAVIQKLNALGGASCSYFEGVLNNAGFEVTCTSNFSPATAGSRVGARLTNGARPAVAGDRVGTRLFETGWTYWWEINSPENIVTYATAGSRVGERLANFGNERIECIIERLKPAHTNVLFTYGP